MWPTSAQAPSEATKVDLGFSLGGVYPPPLRSTVGSSGSVVFKCILMSAVGAFLHTDCKGKARTPLIIGSGRLAHVGCCGAHVDQ